MNGQTQLSMEKVDIVIQKVEWSNFEDIATIWQELETCSDPQFFLSWKWIGCWLKQVMEHYTCLLLIAKHSNSVIGLGIFVERHQVFNKFFFRKRWYLHQSGDQKLDQIWIENNDFLVARDYQQQLTSLILQFLCQHQTEVDEFIISMQKIYNKKSKSIYIPYGYKPLIGNQQPGFRILINDFNNLNDYLAQLSKNTRHQIKRSLALLNQQDGLIFEVIEDKAKQILLLEQTKHWHIEKWQHSVTPSGFSNPQFVHFHRSLIRKNNLTANTLIASLSINNQIKAILYCFEQNQVCYFYLSNIQRQTDNRIKLGLVVHSLLVEWLIKNRPDILQYDLLAGYERYKESLAHESDQYQTIIIQKRNFKFSLENLLKNLKDFLKRKRILK